MRVGLEDATVDGGVAPGAEPCEPGVNEASTGAVHVEAEEEYMTMGNRMPNCSSRSQPFVRSNANGAQPGQPGQAAAPEGG